MSNLSLKRDFVTHISKLNYAFDKKILKNRPKFLNYASSAILRKSAKKMLVQPNYAKKSASTIGKSLVGMVFFCFLFLFFYVFYWESTVFGWFT